MPHIIGHASVVQTVAGHVGIMFLLGLGAQFITRFITRIRG